MSMFAGMMAGLGQGIATIGQGMAKAQSDLEELKLKAEARREEKLLELREKRELEREKLANQLAVAEANRDPVKGFLAKFLEANVPVEPTDRSRFEKTEVFAGEEGPDQRTTFDQEGYAKAESARLEHAEGLINRILKPEAYKALQEGKGQEYLNDLTQSAASEKDSEKRDAMYREAGVVGMVLSGKDRFGVTDGTAYDKATGKTQTTEVGRAEINRDMAAADKDKQTDPNVRSSGDTGDIRPRDQYNNLSRQLADLDKEIASTMVPKAKEALQAQRAEVQRRLDELMGKKSDEPAKDGGLVRVASRAEWEKLKPGTRFIAPDGSIRVK